MNILELDVSRMIFSALGVGAPVEPEVGIAPDPLDEAQAVDQAEAVIEGSQAELLAQVVQQQAETQQALAAVQQAMALVARQQLPARPVHATVPAEVRARAREILTREPLFLDYETTGLRKRPYDYAYYRDKSTRAVHQVLGLAIMDQAGHILFQGRLNPGRPISPGAAAVHGITGDQVAGLPAWEQIAPLAQSYLQGRAVVAFNAGFDASFTPDWGIEWICLKALADRAFGTWHHSETDDWRRSASLENRLRQCGLHPGQAHSAAGDCLSAVRLLRYLAGYSQI